MARRRGRALSECGQALAELPFVIGVTVALTLTLVQPALCLIAKIAVSQAAGEAARVAATAWSDKGVDPQGMVEAFVAQRLQKLGAVPALMVPGSLAVACSGNPRSQLVSVTVKIEQRPLPLVGRVMAGSSSVIKIGSSASAPGGEAWVSSDTPHGEVTFGEVQKP